MSLRRFFRFSPSIPTVGSAVTQQANSSIFSQIHKYSLALRESVYTYPASRAGPEANESLEWLTTIILGLLKLGCGLWSLLLEKVFVHAQCTSQWVLSWTDGSVSFYPSLCTQGWPGTPGDPPVPVSSVIRTLAQPAAFGYNSTILSCFFFCNTHQALPLF